MPLLIVALTVALAAPTVVSAGQAAPTSGQSAPISSADLGQVYFLFLQGRELAARRPPDLRGAIESYRKALAIVPTAAAVRAELAGLYARANQFPEARAEAGRVIEQEPANRDAHRVLGLVDAAMIQQTPGGPTSEMLREAIGHLEYALAGGYTDLAVQLTIAELYLQNGDMSKAAAAARRFLDDQPGYAPMVMVLVAALEGSGQSAEAAQALVDMREEPAGELLALADSFFDRGLTRHVVSLLEPRVTAPTPEDLASGAFGEMAGALGRAFTELGEPKRAIAALESARSRKATGVPLLFSLGAAYERDGQYDAAERTFRLLIAESPTHAATLNYLGYMLADRGQKLDEAVELIKRALAVAGDVPSFLDSLGWAYFRQRKFEEARPPLERAAVAMPDVSVVQDHLGDLYVEMKRYGEAVGAFDRALGGDREDVDVAAITKKRDRARQLALPK